MRPDDRDAGYLLDMLQHARGVVRATGGRTLEEYAEDEDLRLLVERRLEIVGEAARHVSGLSAPHTPKSPGARSSHSGMCWRMSMARYRMM